MSIPQKAGNGHTKKSPDSEAIASDTFNVRQNMFVDSFPCQYFYILAIRAKYRLFLKYSLLTAP
jgi:hypothetical protein